MKENSVLEACHEFLRTYFGDSEDDGRNQSAYRQIGLRLVCLGNAEKTVQGELLHFLRMNNFCAVSECGIYGVNHRSLDISVFDEDWTPLCVIELKHYSTNQGSVDTLLKNIKADYRKHAETNDITLIQIGLFTEICEVTPYFDEQNKNVSQKGFYRFLKTYYKSQKPEIEAICRNTESVDRKKFVSPNVVMIDVDGHKIIGRIHHVLMSWKNIREGMTTVRSGRAEHPETMAAV